METFSDYLDTIEEPKHRERLDEILTWVKQTYPNLEPVIKWNTPMFADHGTFIIGIDKAKQHISLAPEEVAMVQFADEIEKAGYSSTKGLFRIKWNQPVDYNLIGRIIEYNMQEKAEYNKFWR
ncbi:iron chaperone [Halalkalibacillus halophilus]|uniref:iron chaperone n=1 Tax=Halalkalibacillus halophilus TaxID=392827 RepID=UPI0004223C43|nr:iron chaperone [Halalkalibacillus halophilus]